MIQQKAAHHCWAVSSGTKAASVELAPSCGEGDELHGVNVQIIDLSYRKIWRPAACHVKSTILASHHLYFTLSSMNILFTTARHYFLYSIPTDVETRIVSLHKANCMVINTLIIDVQLLPGQVTVSTRAHRALFPLCVQAERSRVRCQQRIWRRPGSPGAVDPACNGAGQHPVWQRVRPRLLPDCDRGLRSLGRPQRMTAEAFELKPRQ